MRVFLRSQIPTGHRRDGLSLLFNAWDLVGLSHWEWLSWLDAGIIWRILQSCVWNLAETTRAGAPGTVNRAHTGSIPCDLGFSQQDSWVPQGNTLEGRPGEWVFKETRLKLKASYDDLPSKVMQCHLYHMPSWHHHLVALYFSMTKIYLYELFPECLGAHTLGLLMFFQNFKSPRKPYFL